MSPLYKVFSNSSWPYPHPRTTLISCSTLIFAQYLATAKTPASQRYDVIRRDLAPPNAERELPNLVVPRASGKRSCASVLLLKI